MTYKFVQNLKFDIKQMRNTFQKTDIQLFHVSYEQVFSMVPASLYNLIVALLEGIQEVKKVNRHMIPGKITDMSNLLQSYLSKTPNMNLC